jgi:molybdate transport system substrate-binding protein
MPTPQDCRRRRTVLLLAGAALVLAGCGDDGEHGDATLTVLAASSLTDAFGELEATYESDHPDVDVQLSFDSSSTLAEQVVQGAPADVLATADETTMQSVVDEELTGSDPVGFAQNQLCVVTPPANPADIQTITDLDDPGVAYAVCAPDAPCGAATQELLDIVGVTADPVTEEDNVRDTLGKVTEAEVDAGLVYVSDARAAGDDVHVVDVPQAAHVLNADVITVLADAEDPDEAQAWVDLVTSQVGQRVLQSHGFRPAP